jgi:nucleoside 2-deoxyribosyltransferase
MKAYISVSYAKRKFLDRELDTIIEVLKNLEVAPFVFVDNYRFDLTQEREMMQQVMADIASCDLLIAETSDKGIGIGVEVGYAIAMNKPVIYIRQKNAEHSGTVSGISNYQIVYSDPDDLKKHFVDTMKRILTLDN